MQIIDLSGSWNYRTDEKDNGIQEQYYNQKFVSSPFLLPGSTCDNHIGTPTQYHEEFNPQTVRAPRERYEYVGPLWLQKKNRHSPILSGPDHLPFPGTCQHGFPALDRWDTN